MVSERKKGIGVGGMGTIIAYPSTHRLHIHKKTFLDKTPRNTKKDFKDSTNMIQKAFPCSVLVISLLLSLTTISFAEETSDAHNTVPGSFSHTHSYGRDNIGLGADVIVLRPTENTALSAQTRYDFENERWSLFGVVSVDLTEYYGK